MPSPKLKERLRRAFPRVYQLLRGLRYAYGGSELDSETSALAARLCGGKLRVLSGPFQGLLYVGASGSGLLPKLAGSYEQELHPAVEESLLRGYDLVVNVGSGEGYYAVGYARRLPRATVHAFDDDPLARQRLGRLARRNGVEARIRIGGRCGWDDLARLLRGRALVVCDCEGCELALLDPDRVPALRAADLLVELHDFVDPSISRTIENRFAASHDLTIVAAEGRGAALAGELLAPFTPSQRAAIVEEGRPPGMRWAWARAKP
jgi:hypothetical protein